MTNGDKKIDLFTIADNDKKYKDITPKFIDWNQFYDYKDDVLMLCDKIYHLVKRITLTYHVVMMVIYRLILWNVNRFVM